jgi:polysaccharide biosynthesis transport protein
MTASPGYAAVSRRALDFEDYIDVARRHAAWIAGPVFAGVVISVCVAFFQQNSYESMAVMQITPSQISDELVKSTVNQRLTERIIAMEATILSRTNLSGLIQDPNLKLYPQEMASKPIEDVIEQMRKDINISIKANPIERNGGSTFSISFTYPSRIKAQATVQALITKFENESTNSQQTQQALLKNFFGDELQIAKANLEKRNQDLSRFRAENQGRLPEQSQMNMASLASLQNQVNGINDQLNRLATERVSLQTHLSSLKSQMELTGLMAQESAPVSSFSPVARKNQELENLNKEIAAEDLRLQQLLQQYKETYPDIRDIKLRLQVLKKQRDTIVAEQEKDSAEEAAKPREAPKKSTNFQVAQSMTTNQANIDATNAMLANNDFERANKLKEQERLNKEIEAYRLRLSATSGIEAMYADLQREYSNAAQQYQDALRKKELTAQSSNLIQRKATETLDVLDPPSLPTNPSKPNRWQIVGVGIGISFMLGIALAGVQEARDTSLKNLKDVRAYTNLPVLCSIPLLENTLLVKRKRRIMYLLWSAAVLIGIIAVCAALFYYYTVTRNA